MATNRTATRKGKRVERELVELHRDLGIEAQRVPRSGAAGGAFAGDVHLHLFGGDVEPLVGEVKARASGEGFKTLARWLDGADILFLRADRQPPMVCLPWATWAKVVGLLGRE